VHDAVKPLFLRLLALGAAIAMVVGALAVRNRMDDDEVSRSTELRLLCATELEEVCNALADDPDSSVIVTTEEVGATVDRLRTAPKADFDAWLTPGPFPQMVQELRRSQSQLAPVFHDVSAPLARSPVVIVGWNDRLAALKTKCEIGWKCIGLAAGQPWSAFGGKPEWAAVTTSLPDPTTSAAGLLTLGAATAGFFGRADLSTDDLDADDGFGSALSQLARNNNTPVSVSSMLAAGPSLVAFVAGLEQAVKPVVSAASRDKRNQVTLIYPSPVVNADVVLGMADRRKGERLLELLRTDVVRAAFTDDGWKPPGSGRSGLPSPGLLSVLRSRWSQ
jgi:hypothetical protein